jgi:hypothetical protein
MSDDYHEDLSDINDGEYFEMTLTLRDKLLADWRWVKGHNGEGFYGYNRPHDYNNFIRRLEHDALTLAEMLAKMEHLHNLFEGSIKKVMFTDENGRKYTL